MKLSIPYTKGLSKILEPYKENIHDVFFTDGILMSGRLDADAQYDRLYLELSKLKEMGIKRNFLLNSPLINKNDGKFKRGNIVDTFKHIERILHHFDIITISNIQYFFNDEFMELLKEKEVKNSVNNFVASKYGVDEAFKVFQYDYINIDRGINRDNKKINELCDYIREKNSKAVVLVNEGCHHECSMKHFCDIMLADRNQSVDGFDCYDFYLKNNPENYLKSPMLFHQNIQTINADIFKISGRGIQVDVIEKRIRHYLYGENVLLREIVDKPVPKNHPIYELDYETMLKYNFINVINDCKNDCYSCHHCDKLLEII